MASSSIPLSLLAKGIGQLSKNGHERLDVYLEPEDYYNLQSQYQQYQLRALRQQAVASGTKEQFEKAHEIFPLHKTFLTRKGALLLFSEELAKKALEEEKSKREEKFNKEKHAETAIDELNADVETEAEALRTCNDLSWAILRYGKPEYRRKGDDLYLRFVHEAKGNVRNRSIRPGFSPKRYISTWSRTWNDGMLQKLRSGGMISDKTLYRQNPLLPHLYKYASYNLSANPPPYRVTKNMLLPPGNVPSYEFYRVRAPQQAGSIASREAANKAPPPSQLDDPMVDPAPIGAIQAVRYHESGEIQEVTYSELKPQEKQEILAELLIAAHEHQQHIRDTLELVMSTNRNRVERSDQGGTASSASSELMADMHRAIMSLVESPVRQQMRERQRLLREQEERLEEERRQQQLKEEKKQKRRQERKARKAAEAEKAAEEAAKLKKAAEKAELEAAVSRENERKLAKELDESKPDPAKVEEEDAKLEEKRLKEERKRKRREEREARRKIREDRAAQVAQEQKEAAKIVEENSAVVARPSSNRETETHDRKSRKQRKHRQRQEHAEDIEAEERKRKEERRSRRKLEKQAEMTYHLRRSKEGLTEDRGQVDAFPDQARSQRRVHVRASEQVEVTDDHYDGEDAQHIYASLPQDGITEIEHDNVRGRPKLHRRMTGISIPAPANTPAIETRSIPASPLQEGVEYEEVILLEKPKRRRRSNASSADEYKSRTRSDRPTYELRDGAHSASRSVASSQSSGPKQILFAPEMPDDGSSSQKQGSFYGGRMPITSNLVKQTLSDKMSIISASQDSIQDRNLKPLAEPLSSIGRPSGKGSLISDKIVPSIGIEPATPLNPKQSASPMQHSVLSSLNKSVPGTQYLSPTQSFSGSQRSLGQRSEGSEDQSSHKRRDSYNNSDSSAPSKKLPSKKSDDSDEGGSDGNDDSSSQSSYKISEKSVKPEVASKSSQTTSQSSKKKKSKHAALLLDESLSSSSKSLLSKEGTEPPIYTGLKGHKGPGSQSSSSMFKSSTSKKSRSTRGSLPSAMKKGEHGIKASVRMPDGEFISVGGSLTRSEEIVESDTEQSEEVSVVDYKSSGQEVQGTLHKSSLKSAKHESKAGDSSTKDTRRVSFHDADVVVGMTTDTEDEDKQASSIDVSDYDVTEEESEADEWPAVKEEEASGGAASSHSRPISSRSEKLTAHAQKVAAMVVKKQRPDSGLDEDAKKAAELWNKASDESEVTSSEEEEEEWAGAKEPVVSISKSSKSLKSDTSSSKQSSEDQEEKKRREKLEKLKAEKPKEKEIRPSVSAATPKKSSTVSGSVTSIASSVSSVQEAFVNEIQRKASDLGIDAQDLDFQADVVNRLEQSAITPEEVEVVHDVESGKHIVRSRKSSTSVSSVLTPSTIEKPLPQEVMQEQPITKQQLVVDLNLEKDVTASRSRASSVSSSITSHSRTSGRSSISQRRSSIPVDKSEVTLDYDVTSYESKLGDPKPEEPTIQATRPHVEPEKIKPVENIQAAKSDSVSKLKAETSKPSGTDSVKSVQSSSSKATGKPEKTKHPVAATKGPQRKGQTTEKILDKAEVASSVADSTKKSETQKSLKDAAKSRHSEKGSKKVDAKKKTSKSKPKSEEPTESEQEAPKRVTPEKLPSKTPETPFRAGRAKDPKQDEYMSSAVSPEEKDIAKQESIASVKKEKTKKKKKVEPAQMTQVEKDSPKPPAKDKSKPSPEPSKKAGTPKAVTPAPPPSKKSETKPEEEDDDYPEYVTPVSPEDDYTFVREETPEPTPEPPAPSPPKTPAKSPMKQEDVASQISETTAVTEATGTEQSSQAAAQAAEDEAAMEAKRAAKQEREQKRAAAAEKRRQEVERKRREKEEQIKREKEEQERQEKMKEELEAERKKREDAIRLRKEEAEREKQREKEEEELRQRRILQQQERERKQQEEYRRKMEELQRKKREEDERKREEAKRQAEEEAARRKEEEEMMAQMEESERELYAQRKREEEEERKRKEEELRKRMEEDARIAREQARMEALIRAKQTAALEEKLKFVRDLMMEANGMDQTQNVNRSFTFSYFEIMRMLGLDVVIE